MKFTHENRTYASRSHLSNAGKKMAIRRFLRMPKNHRPIIAGRAPGRGWMPIRICFKENA